MAHAHLARFERRGGRETKWTVWLTRGRYFALSCVAGNVTPRARAREREAAAALTRLHAAVVDGWSQLARRELALLVLMAWDARRKP